MAGQTLNRGYPYPTGTDPNDVPYRMQALAESIDADVEQLADRVASAASAGTWRLNANLPVQPGEFALFPPSVAVGTAGPGLANVGGAVTVSAAGVYEVHAQIFWAPQAGTARRGVFVTVNASSIQGSGILSSGRLVGNIIQPNFASMDWVQAYRSPRFDCAAGDVIRTFVFQDSGVAVNANAGNDSSYLGRTSLGVYKVA